MVRLSERLSALTGKRLGHCSYASDGASSIEIALKMSFHYWRNSGRTRKTRFLSLRNSYHGETIGALAVGDVALFKDSLRAFADERQQRRQSRRARGRAWQ